MDEKKNGNQGAGFQILKIIAAVIAFGVSYFLAYYGVRALMGR